MSGAARNALVALACSIATLPALSSTWAAEELSREDKAMRQQLIDEGKAAANRGDHATALQKLKKADELECHPTLDHAIAVEAQVVSAFAEALNYARLCVAEAPHDKTLKNRKEVEKACQQIVDGVKDLVGHVVVNVPNMLEGLTITAEGRQIQKPVLGDPFPVTPGMVVVEANAPGYRPFHSQVRVGRGQNIPITVSLIKLPEDRSRPSAEKAAPTGPPLRLDDVWSGMLDCPRGVPHAESFRVTQENRTLIATKVVGDDCVPSGAVTWQGALARATVTLADLPLTIPVRITVGAPTGVRSVVGGRLTIDGPDHMLFFGAPGPGFTRGEQAPGASVANDAPGASPPADRNAGLVPAAERALPPPAGPAFDAAGMPPVAQVWRLTGRDPVDAAARQSAAFSQLTAIVRTATDDRPNQTQTVNQLLSAYAAAGRQADQRGQALLARASGGHEAFAVVSSRWFSLRGSYDNERYRSELLRMCSPAVQAAYAAHRR